MQKIDVYLEIGKKRAFAGAIDWPGWCRSGRDETSALQALLDYGSRYSAVLLRTGLEFVTPGDTSAFKVIERLDGGASTDFGAPEKSPASDSSPVDDSDLRRLQKLLQACWQAFDTAAAMAAGKELRKGPRGGGRELEGIIEHVNGADAGYLSRIGRKVAIPANFSQVEAVYHTRQAILEGLEAAARGETPAQGPRGGARWTPRYFVRRAAWHVLDHAWEIEDRILSPESTEENQPK